MVKKVVHLPAFYGYTFLYLGMENSVYLDGQKLECYYKRNGKFFYRHPITKQKVFSQKQEGTGLYNFNFNVPHVIDKTIVFKSYSANLTQSA